MKWLICAALAAVIPMDDLGVDISVPFLKGAVILDGRLDEPMWRNAVRVPQSAFKCWVNDRYTNDPTPFHLRLFHNGRTLYVALVSYDRYVEADALPENSDGLYSLSFYSHDGNIRHYRLRWSKNPPVPGGDTVASGKWGARLVGPFDKPMHPGDGYVLELAIQLSTLGWKPGDLVPINIIVNDRDGKPLVPFRITGAEFARFAWGSFDNENRVGFKTLRLGR